MKIWYGKNMDSEAIMASVIISITALVMLIIGACQYVKKDNPVGFYNVTAPPKKEEISDIIQYFHYHL